MTPVSSPISLPLSSNDVAPELSRLNPITGQLASGQHQVWPRQRLSRWLLTPMLLACASVSFAVPDWLEQVPEPQSDSPVSHQRLAQDSATRLLNWLIQQDYSFLNSAYVEFDKVIQLDAREDLLALDAYRVWSQSARQFTLDDFDRWVASAPTNYQPLLARSWFLYGKALLQRQESIELMATTLAEARMSADAALKINPDATAAVVLQLVIHDYLGQQASEAALVDQIIRRWPVSAALTTAIVRTGGPLHGGSNQEMLERALQLQAALQTSRQAGDADSAAINSTNADGQWAFAVVLQQAAEAALKARQVDTADSLLERAVSYADHWQIAYDQARLAYFYRKDRQAAAVAVEQAIELASAQPEPHVIEARLAFSEGRFEESLEALQWSRNLLPAGTTSAWQEWAADRLLKQAEAQPAADAIDTLLLAVGFDPDNAARLAQASQVAAGLGNTNISQGLAQQACALGEQGSCELIADSE